MLLKNKSKGYGFGNPNEQNAISTQGNSVHKEQAMNRFQVEDMELQKEYNQEDSLFFPRCSIEVEYA